MSSVKACRAKNPSLCSFHGAPHPVLSLPVAKRELRKVDSDLRSAEGKGEFEEYERLRGVKSHLEKRMMFLGDQSPVSQRMKEGDGTFLTKAYVEYHDDVKVFKRNAFVSKFGAGSVEVQAFDQSNESLVANGKFKQFSYALSDYGFGYQADNGSERDEARSKAEALAARVGADGAMPVKIGIMTGAWTPYKLKAGQLHPVEREAVMSRPDVAGALTEISEALVLIREGKGKKLNK